jgi:hypothetical protein
MIDNCQPGSNNILELLSFIYRVEINEGHDEILAALEVGFEKITDQNLLDDYEKVKESVLRQKATADENKNALREQFGFLDARITETLHSGGLNDIWGLYDSSEKIKKQLNL